MSTTEYTVDGLLQAIEEASQRCRAVVIAWKFTHLDLGNWILARARELDAARPTPSSNSAPIASSNGVTDEDVDKADKTIYPFAQGDGVRRKRRIRKALESFAQSRTGPLAVTKQLADALRGAREELENVDWVGTGDLKSAERARKSALKPIDEALAAYDAQKVTDGTDRKGGEKS